MIGYVTLGALDTEAALPFFDAVFGALDLKRSFFDHGWAGYGPEGGEAEVYVCPPHDGQTARAGNGVMISFLADTQQAVDAAHAAALANGGADEGAPGNRPPEKAGFYGAYFRDPTGNKLCVFTRN